MIEFYARLFMISTFVFQFLWLRERSKRKYAELDRTSVELYWRNEEARVSEKFLELEAEYKELLVEKKREGEWVKSDIPGEEYVCSACGGACWYYDVQGFVAKSRYCPNCGAKMKREEGILEKRKEQER